MNELQKKAIELKMEIDKANANEYKDNPINLDYNVFFALTTEQIEKYLKDVLGTDEFTYVQYKDVPAIFDDTNSKIYNYVSLNVEDASTHEQEKQTIWLRKK